MKGMIVSMVMRDVLRVRNQTRMVLRCVLTSSSSADIALACFLSIFSPMNLQKSPSVPAIVSILSKMKPRLLNVSSIVASIRMSKSAPVCFSRTRLSVRSKFPSM